MSDCNSVGSGDDSMGDLSCHRAFVLIYLAFVIVFLLIFVWAALHHH